MVYSLAYRRPPHVDSSRSSINEEAKTRSIVGSVHSGSSGMSFGIPNALSFDNIITGGTCPVSSSLVKKSRQDDGADIGIQPCTTRDFMNYLIYIEYAAENLQFYLWHRDYVKRFSALPPNERALAPEWTVEQAEAELLVNQTTTATGPKIISREAAAVFKGTDFAPSTAIIAPPTPSMVDLKNSDPFNTPPRTPTADLAAEGRNSPAPSDLGWGEDESIRVPAKSYQKRAACAFAEADLKWQPCKLGSMDVSDVICD